MQRKLGRLRRRFEIGAADSKGTAGLPPRIPWPAPIMRRPPPPVRASTAPDLRQALKQPGGRHTRPVCRGFRVLNFAGTYN